MGIAETSSFFKNAHSGRFFDGEAEPAQMSFRPHSSSFGGGLHGMGSNAMPSLSSQHHNGGMYSTFDSQLFSGSDGGESSAVPFHGAHGRRLGFGFGLDVGASSFGFTEQRDTSLRESTFSEQAFRNSATLFDL